MEQLSNKIRRLRFENSEMTQKALAERVGISRQTMNAIENCHRAPTVSVAIRIADVLQVLVDDLFTLDYEGKPTPIKRPARAATERSTTPVREPAYSAGNPSPACTNEPVREAWGPTPKPVEEKAPRKTTLADLRGVVDS